MSESVHRLGPDVRDSNRLRPIPWNEFVFALVLTSSEAAQTLPIAVSLFVADDFVDWAHLAAGGMIAALPGILFGLFFQQYIVSGLTQGAVKE